MTNQRLYPTLKEQQEFAEAKKRYGLKDSSEPCRTIIQAEAKAEEEQQGKDKP